MEILSSMKKLVSSDILFPGLIASLKLTFESLVLSIAVTLLVVYASVIPFFRPLALLIVRMRYLTLTGLIFVFTLLTQDGSTLKLSLLVLGIVPFFVTSFLSVLNEMPQQQLELCKTLGFSNWQSLYEVIIVGKADQAFEIMRQNFAIAWMMITMVEGVSMSEGGLGTLLIKFNKYNDIASVFSLQLIIFLLGIGFDYLLGSMRKWLFPYIHVKKNLR